MTLTERGDLRDLEEFLVLLEVEPDLYTVVVEGHADQGFYSWYLSEHDLDADVRSVDEYIDVPSTRVYEIGLEPSARSRVIALAHAVHQVNEDLSAQFTGVVDADHSRVAGPIFPFGPILLMTDVPDLESYALSERPLRKFLHTFAHLSDEQRAIDVLNDLTPRCRALLAFRISMGQRHHPVTKKFGKYSFPKNSEAIDFQNLATACSLDAATRAEVSADFAVFAEWCLDADQHSRGHDFAELLRIYVGDHGRPLTLDSVNRGLLTSIDLADIDHYPLFRNLRLNVSRRHAS